jgi:ClpP class serine protease
VDIKILKAALGKVWLMDEMGARYYAELLDHLINGTATISAGLFDEVELPYRTNTAGTRTNNGSVFVLPIEGALMANDYCGSMGTESMSRLLKAAYKDNSIDGIVLKWKSPGGSVDGTEDFSNTIAEKTKTVLSWVRMGCSAAYWAMSPSSEIMISGETAMVGSIGTMSTMRDTRASEEKRGYKEVVTFASRSIHKNRSAMDALDGKPEAYITEILDPLNAAFENAVLKNRAGKIDLKKEDVGTGKVYIGSNIINVGLADSKGSIEDAIKRSIQLAKSIK